jgi:hypothetical protein
MVVLDSGHAVLVLAMVGGPRRFVLALLELRVEATTLDAFVNFATDNRFGMLFGRARLSVRLVSIAGHEASCARRGDAL